MKYAFPVRGGITLLLIFFLFSMVISAARAEKQKLARDTALAVQGVAQQGAQLLFAGITTVQLNDEKQVRRGTLAKETALVVPGTDAKVAFCRNSEVEFSMTGHVQKGIMTTDQALKVDGLKKVLKFKGNLPIYFGMDGVSAGTLAEPALLGNPKHKGAEEKYPAGTYVMFTISGQVYMIQPPGK